ncbi:uncharacterized protein BJX67DRAFT_212347 [Aspergillus lucknowensis]|uniref:Uncharacterized protein n=1 Tax=Aspergillus lucknowensis TaxID=176173 RepID=A0ABR4M2M9_9EURO
MNDGLIRPFSWCAPGVSGLVCLGVQLPESMAGSATRRRGRKTAYDGTEYGSVTLEQPSGILPIFACWLGTGRGGIT